MQHFFCTRLHRLIGGTLLSILGAGKNDKNISDVGHPVGNLWETQHMARLHVTATADFEGKSLCGVGTGHTTNHEGAHSLGNSGVRTLTRLHGLPKETHSIGNEL